MEKNINILIAAGSFNYNCGVSKHLFYLIRKLPQNVNVYLLIPDGTSIGFLNSIRVKYFIEPSLSYQRRNIPNLIKAIFSIYRYAKKLKIDIIHSHNYYAANAAGIAGKLANIKTVQTMHSYFKREGHLKKYFADYYILVNEYLADKAKEEKEYHEKQMKVIYNGIDVNHINKIKTGKDKNEKLELLVASRLIYQKGVQTVIEAFSLLSGEDREKINFQIAGTGDYKPELEKYATERGVNAIFLGEVSDISSLFLSCDIFIFSSYTDGLPMALLEAGAHECFIITSDFEGILSIFRPGVDGFIYKKHSARELADVIIRALKSDDERQKYIDSFKTILNKRFTSEMMAENTYNYYMEIIK
jgi:glycosyltransferase involved in cell wall biosynthesis